MDESKTYGDWILANTDKKGTPEFAEKVVSYRQAKVQELAGTREAMEARKAENAALARENEAAYQRKQELEAAGTGPARLAVMLQQFVPKTLETAKRATFAGGATAVGQITGKRFAGNTGAVVGGAVASAMAELMQQGIDVSEDPNARFQPGRVYGAAIQGAFPTQSPVANAFANAEAQIVHSLVDERKFPELRELSQSAATGYVAGKVSSAISGKVLKRNETLLQFKYDTFRKLRSEGIVVNPAELERSDALLETAKLIAGGNQAVAARAINENQYIFQALARKELGLSKEQLPFRPTRRLRSGSVIKGEIDTAIELASKPYEEIRAISTQAAKDIADFQAGKVKSFKFASKTPQDVDIILAAGDNLDALKRSRIEIKDSLQAMKAAEPGALKRFEAAKELEDTLEAKIDEAANLMGKPFLVKKLKNARVYMAKAFALKNSVDDVTGILDVQALDALRATGSKPGIMLTGKLADIADFARAFSRNAQDAVNAPMASVPGAAVNYTARNLAQGNAAGLVSAGVPLVGRPAQNYILSKGVQDELVDRAFVTNADRLPSAGARNMIMQMGRGNLPPEQRPVPLR